MMLNKRGVKTNPVKPIKSIFEVTTYYIVSQCSQKFETSERSIQKGILIPMLFNIFMNEIIKSCKTEMEKMITRYRSLQPVNITEHALLMISVTEQCLQQSLNLCYQ